jgi:hypothetical protein
MDAMLRDGLNKLEEEGRILGWVEVPGIQYLLQQKEYRKTIFRFLKSEKMGLDQLVKNLETQRFKKIVVENDDESSARATTMGRLQDIARDRCLAKLRATARDAVGMHAWIQPLRREQEQEQEQEQG